MFGENYGQSTSSQQLSNKQSTWDSNNHQHHQQERNNVNMSNKQHQHHQQQQQQQQQQQHDHKGNSSKQKHQRDMKHKYVTSTPSLEVRSHNILYPNRNNDHKSQWQQEQEEREEEETRPKTVQEIIRALDEQQSVSGPKGGCCSRMCIPFVVIALVILIFTAVIWTSGSAVSGEANPRVALIIFEGFTAPTFDRLIKEEQHLPNLASSLLTHGGLYASCESASESECARASGAENEQSSNIHYCHACGMATILSGVTSLNHHVISDSLSDMLNYADSSKHYPSLAERITRNGMKVTAIGTSHLLHSFDSSNGRCAMGGLLDVECASSTSAARASSIDPLTHYISLDCLSGSSCNVAHRRLRQPTNPNAYADEREQAQFTEQLTSLFGSLAFQTPEQKSAIQNSVADNLDDALFIFHFDDLAVRAEGKTLSDFTYSSSSLSYVAQAYLLDALIGQILSFVNDRARSQKENWLIVGVGTKGGNSNTSSQGTENDDDEESAIPFFMTTYTTNTKQHITLHKLKRPISQLDVLPTILRWLNVPPYDETTENAWNTASNTEYVTNASSNDFNNNNNDDKNNNVTDATLRERLAERRQFIGQVQGICSSGLNPTDCVN